MRIQTPENLDSLRKTGLTKIQPGKPRIGVGTSSCGIAVGGMALYNRLYEIIQTKRLDIMLVKTGCIGFCKEEPIVSVRIPGYALVLLHNVTPDDAERIISSAMRGKVPKDLALCTIPDWDHITGHIVYGNKSDDIRTYEEIPFFAHQKKVILRDSGLINPEDIDEYIGIGGYFAAFQAISCMEPDAIIDEVKQSGLRGRGGAGFPTGLKWEITKNAPGDEKYIVCNADEGDPGAYMNRNEMESDPHMLIEGMLIGAYAMGVHEGLIYIRAEYPLAIQRLMIALDQARTYGLLGKNIFNSGFDFDIQIATGAGAFVCGESTALAVSIEGKTGRPRLRPPRLTEKGIFGKPTDLNNVETWCNVPVIIAKGASWYSSIGAKGNTGTKVFSLVGKVENVGMVEVPLEHACIRSSRYRKWGADGREWEIGSDRCPSGGCVPVRLFVHR
jgi:NADH-quinone oxidoreductase subunit F